MKGGGEEKRGQRSFGFVRHVGVDFKGDGMLGMGLDFFSGMNEWNECIGIWINVFMLERL